LVPSSTSRAAPASARQGPQHHGFLDAQAEAQLGELLVGDVRIEGTRVLDHGLGIDVLCRPARIDARCVQALDLGRIGHVLHGGLDEAGLVDPAGEHAQVRQLGLDGGRRVLEGEPVIDEGLHVALGDVPRVVEAIPEFAQLLEAVEQAVAALLDGEGGNPLVAFAVQVVVLPQQVGQDRFPVAFHVESSRGVGTSSRSSPVRIAKTRWDRIDTQRRSRSAGSLHCPRRESRAWPAARVLASAPERGLAVCERPAGGVAAAGRSPSK
jgi:hypothetical protein